MARPIERVTAGLAAWASGRFGTNHESGEWLCGAPIIPKTAASFPATPVPILRAIRPALSVSEEDRPDGTS